MAGLDPLNLEFAKRHPQAFAHILGRVDAEDCARIVDSLPADDAAAIVSRLPASRVEWLLQADDARPVQWLETAEFGDAIALLSRIPRERRLAFVNAIGDQERKRRLLRHQQFPSHSVGALVSDIPMRIGSEANAADVLAELRDIDVDDPGPLIVVDGDGRYIGIVDRWRLLMANPPVGQVRDYVDEVKALRPETPANAAIALPDWHTRNWLPVVDHEKRVLGGVSRAAVFRAASADGAEPTSGVFLELFADVTHLFAKALEKALSRSPSQ